jgi:hypothetical protein
VLFMYVSSFCALRASHIWYFHIFCDVFSGHLLNTIFDRLQDILFYVGMCGEVYSYQHMKQGSILVGPHNSIFKLLSSWAFLWEIQIVHMISFQISLLVLEFIKTVHLIYWFVLLWHSVWWSSNITISDSLYHTLLNAYVKNLLYLATVMLKTCVFLM